MENKVDYHKVRTYLESLANAHTKIDHFIGFNEEELHTALNQKLGLPGIILVPFKYEGALNGNDQRTLAGRVIHFAVLNHIKVNDFLEESRVIADCENIGLSVLGRISYDSRKESSEWLYNNFDKNTVEFNEIRLKSSAGLVGMEFSFTLRTPQSLAIDPEEWSDIEVPL